MIDKLTVVYTMIKIGRVDPECLVETDRRMTVAFHEERIEPSRVLVARHLGAYVLHRVILDMTQKEPIPDEHTVDVEQKSLGHSIFRATRFFTRKF